MYCPYAVTRLTVKQTTMEYDNDGNQTSWEEIEGSTAEFIECKKEQCGVWKDGQCGYKGR